ncbi:migration and invasion-inhibitory protein [Pelobates fuscus]|uniref:migration and invasion-inhibitory protein n=1 Tax=Pelobates fuscus TaxID=191477 RepID=UPI002FE46E98
MSNQLEELRKANKCLLDHLKVKHDEFKKLLNPAVTRADPLIITKWLPEKDGKENRTLNGFRRLRAARGLNNDKDPLQVSVQGHTSAARNLLCSSRKSVQTLEESGISKPIGLTEKTMNCKRPETLGKEPEQVIKLQSPVKRLSLLNSSEAFPDASIQYTSQQYAHRLTDEGNLRTPKSILVTPKSRDIKRDAGHVTFLSSTKNNQPATWSTHPLLGYDWIAGVLELDSPITDKSDQFFSEIQEFRRVNREECVLDFYTEAEDLDSVESEEELDVSLDTHQCVYCYRVNNRLFTSPIGPVSACPICKKRRSRRPPTVEEPAYIRVSIPRSTLLPPYKYKAHRRKSFDPTDSLALPSHCLAGWEHSVPSYERRATSLDLKASLDPKTVPAVTTTTSYLGGETTQPASSIYNDSVSYFASRARSENLLNMSRASFFQRNKTK